MILCHGVDDDAIYVDGSIAYYAFFFPFVWEGLGPYQRDSHLME